MLVGAPPGLRSFLAGRRTRQNQARSAIESTAAAAAAAVRGANAGKNPYAEWWSLRFEKQPAGAGGHTPAWSYLSSVEYAPVLLQVRVEGVHACKPCARACLY